MKKILFTLILASTYLTAQETPESAKENSSKNNFDIGADIQSRYIWRGLQFGGNSPSIQPTIEYSTGKFALGVWGAYSLGGDNTSQETDLYLTYSPSETISITVTDYFFPTEGVQNNYFEYGNATGHVYEAMLSFSGTKKFPIDLTVATNFAGADKNNNDQSYSTYLEAGYATKINDTGIRFFAGGVIGDNGGYYLTNGSGIINIGISAEKELKITNSYSLPVNAALAVNPDQENIYLTFGFSL